jgi:hypothetical protein
LLVASFSRSSGLFVIVIIVSGFRGVPYGGLPTASSNRNEHRAIQQSMIVDSMSGEIPNPRKP